MRKIGGSKISKNILIDISNIAHRCFHNLKTRHSIDLSIDNSYELSIKTVEVLNTLLRDLIPLNRIVACLDGKSVSRIAAYPEYKANRKEEKIFSSHWKKCLSDGTYINKEYDLFIYLLKLLGCEIMVDLNHEADDCIASFVSNHSDQFNIIISDDKDFFQLLTFPRTVVYRVSDRKFYDAEASTNYWTKLNKGAHPPVRPNQLRMFKSLCGDSSDNIKGVYRITKKAALSLCDFSIDEIFTKGIETLSDIDRQKVLSSESLIRLNYDLVGIKGDLDLSITLNKGNKDLEKFRSILLKDLNSSVPISQFCDLDAIENKSILPDWYKDL